MLRPVGIFTMLKVAPQALAGMTALTNLQASGMGAACSAPCAVQTQQLGRFSSLVAAAVPLATRSYKGACQLWVPSLSRAKGCLNLSGPPSVNCTLQLRLLDMPDAPADDVEHNGWYPLLHLTALQACHRRF